MVPHRAKHFTLLALSMEVALYYFNELQKATIFGKQSHTVMQASKNMIILMIDYQLNHQYEKWKVTLDRTNEKSKILVQLCSYYYFIFLYYRTSITLKMALGISELSQTSKIEIFVKIVNSFLRFDQVLKRPWERDYMRLLTISCQFSFYTPRRHQKTPVFYIFRSSRQLHVQS